MEHAARAGYEVVGVYKETLSGIRKARGKQPVERARVMALAQRREIDAVLVTELTRWGRSTQDLMNTLGELASWDVSLIAQTGLTFDLSTPQGRLVASLMASLAEFEHELLRERVRSGIAAARARGQRFGREKGYRPSDARTRGDPPGRRGGALAAGDSGTAGAQQDDGERDPEAARGACCGRDR
jgi:putative DNA-invertase from lambdoid prophage Rac